MRSPTRRLPSVAALCGLVVLAGLALVVAPRRAGAQAFTPGIRIDLNVNGLASGSTTADVNGDGKIDLVTANILSSTVSVLPGDGVGGWGVRIDSPIASNPGAVDLAVADINGDGKPDLAVANNGLNSVSVLLGNGVGGFGARTDIAVAGAPLQVFLLDFNGDGRVDLGVSIPSPGEFEIFPGNGAGGFGTPFQRQFPQATGRAAVGDINHDGVPDVCLTCGGSSLTFMRSNGMGGYTPSSLLSFGAAPAGNLQGIALADLNGDGNLDIAVADAGNSTDWVLLGDGSGFSFTPSSVSPGFSPGRIAIADMTGDGLPDIVTMGTSANFRVLKNQGGGTFALSGPLVATPTNITGISLADLNGDGQPEVVNSFVSATAASIVFNDSKLYFRSATSVVVGTTPRGIAAGDLNGDGRPDLVVANSGANTVSVLLATAAGGYTARADYATGATPYGVAIGDITGDGKPDIVVTNDGASTISVLPGNGAGGFGTKTDYPVDAGPASVVLADLNRDGRLDAMVTDNAASDLSVLLNNGTGGFAAAVFYSPGANPIGGAVGDLNGDGWPDIVVPNGSSASVSVLLGTGGGAFGPKTNFTTGTTPLALALADVNGDGKLDIAVANSGSNSVSVLLGTGTGALGAKTDIAIGAATDDVVIGDINGDGRPDIAAIGGGAVVYPLLGNGTGGFTLATLDQPATGSGTQYVLLVDLSGDARPDLATTNATSNTVSICTAWTPTRTTLATPASPVVAGWPMTLSATIVSPSLASPALTDSVRFFDGFTLLGTAPVASGQAALSLFAPYLGDRAITAVYKGDPSHFASYSNVVLPRVVATPAAAIAGIVDVASDQGSQVRLSFARSPYDYPGSGVPITGYQVYRRSLVADAMTTAGPIAPSSAAPAGVELAGWDYLVTVPATTDDVYQVVVPTVADSTASGFHRAVLFVRAATSSPGTYYDSPADSGYSVDNLAPNSPMQLIAAYAGGATHLHWAANAEHDLSGYRLYRGTGASFLPGPGNLVASVPDTGYADAGAAGSYYKLSAVDVHGNESAYTGIGPDATTDVPGLGALAFALESVRPNPSTASALRLSFALPTGAPARLEVFDVRGRRVVAQAVTGAGPHTLSLASARLAPGVYLARLTQGAATATRRAVVVE